MAQPSNLTPTNPPAQMRGVAVIINIGKQTIDPTTGAVAFSASPYAEIVIQGTDPATDASGNRLNDPLGLPGFVDREGWVGDLRIEGAALQAYMALWAQIAPQVDAAIKGYILQPPK